MIKIPFITKQCLFGTTHWRWEEICVCGLNVHNKDPNQGPVWHGGICDMSTGDIELQVCDQCFDIPTAVSDLTEEEQILVECWRTYREDYLAPYGENDPYEYRIIVEAGGTKQFLMSRANTLASLRAKSDDDDKESLPN